MRVYNKMFKFICSLVILTTVVLASSFVSSSFARDKARGIAKQLVEHLNIDLAKFILADSIIPQPFLLKLATTARPHVEAELAKQKDIYHQHLVGKLTMLTDGYLALSMSGVSELIAKELDAQLQEFIAVFVADTHDIMQVSRLLFAIKDVPQFLLDSEYGIDVFISDSKEIDSITMFTPKEEQRSYFVSSDALPSGLRDDLLFTPYHYVLNGNNGVHLFERKRKEHKQLRLSASGIGAASTQDSRQNRKIIQLIDNQIAVIQDTGKGSQTVDKFQLSPYAKLETLNYTGELLQLSPSAKLAAVWDSEQLVIYGGNTREFMIDQNSFGITVEKPLMVQFIETEQLLAMVMGNELGGYNLVLVDLKREVVVSSAVLPERPLQLLNFEGSTYVLTTTGLLRFDADGDLAYNQDLLYSQPKRLYAYEDKRLILVYGQHLQILRADDGVEDFTVYVGDRFRIVDHTVSERYASLLIERIVHDTEFTLTLVQLPVARIIAMFSEDNLLRLAPYAMLDLSHNRTLPLIWNGRTFTLQ